MMWGGDTPSRLARLEGRPSLKRITAAVGTGVCGLLAWSVLATVGPAPAATGAGVTVMGPLVAAGPVAGSVSGSERGAYEWDDSTWWPDPSAYTATFGQLKSLGVNSLYVDITEVVSLTRDHSSELASFEADFGQLVQEANNEGFAVDAVGGDPTWATTDRQGPAQLLGAVSQILTDFPDASLDGVQFDVEPWGLKGWRSHRATYARDWLRFMKTSVTAWQVDGLRGRLGFTVPYWFDGDTGGVPRVTFDGSTNYPFQSSLGILAALPDTMLNVMAYRNTTTGPNGSEALFAGNLTAATADASTTELLVGQETGDVLPAETTFYGLSCATFETATNQIADAFDGDTQYRGIAVDDVESLEALCPG